ncbi:hypothetical protein H0H92_010677 [Tricholoma furcatifolium]|nr:hypothetical protein H0H92_010677 [Tricholoma furcatifolium]
MTFPPRRASLAFSWSLRALARIAGVPRTWAAFSRGVRQRRAELVTELVTELVLGGIGQSRTWGNLGVERVEKEDGDEEEDRVVLAPGEEGVDVEDRHEGYDNELESEDHDTREEDTTLVEGGLLHESPLQTPSSSRARAGCSREVKLKGLLRLWLRTRPPVQARDSRWKMTTKTTMKRTGQRRKGRKSY